jgi:small-conductance mechanosensitive channel
MSPSRWRISGNATALWFALVLAAAAQPSGAPVTFRGEVLFTVGAGLGPFSAGERATAVSRRLEAVARNRNARLEAIAVTEHENSSDIVLDGAVLATVTEADAKLAGQSGPMLAAAYAEKIRAALAKDRSENTLRKILTGAAFTALATVALALLLLAISRLFPLIYARLESWRGTRIRSVRIQRLELISGDRLTNGLVRAARLARMVLIILAFYFYLPLVFSFFPWTRGLAPVLLGYVLQPLALVWHGFVAYVPNLFSIAVALTITYFAIKLARFIFAEVEKGTIRWPGFYPEWAQPTFKIVRFLFLAFAVVVIFPYLPGSDSPGFKGVSIFLGVLFSLGSTSAVANIVAGVILTYTRAFQIGDRVQIADTTGDVVEKTLLATRVLTIKNVSVTIPNGLVLGSHVVNYSAAARQQGLILNTSVTIGYDAPWRKVHELLIGAAAATTHVLRDPPPFVLQTALNDFFVTYEINAYTDQPNLMANTYAELHQNIQDKFNEAGVEIMSPHYSALREGNRKAIPDANLPAGYSAPAFRVLPVERSAKSAG